ncbi:hypothetical protein [Proteocatella sphenisci]|uniref:hypothetical protein n=1 Tax=Proteocatella sphenisci TaxID=181070 RepID=UPI00048F0B62|nr:hypothetical protein [Proteocatella sphenisci]
MRRLLLAILITGISLFVISLSRYSTLSTSYPAAQYYLTNAFSETGSINSVTAIYLYYRYYDTLFEALMLMLSIIGIVYLSINNEDSEHD